ncbi:MAG: class I SAM-dependent methyltransferase family protein, partial [Candidatus Micrarchaeota archaeon]|nr:class I SAM-dependent methyltransferase family protein [Candidatus Micrarchaeota archaeon]
AAPSATASFDTLGDIAIIQVPDAVKAKAKKMAQALLAENPKIKTVLAKASAMKGEFRIRDLEYLAGKRTYTCEYRESGVTMRFDVRKTYFSTRLSFERHRIAGLVKPRENVLALFAGVGPFALVIAKKQSSAQVVAVELNPYAAKAMAENVTLNKLSNVTAIQGDVRDVVKTYPKWADRVTMPLPHTGHDFLPDAIFATSNNGVIHFYGFGDQRDGVFAKAEAEVRSACKAAGVRHKILDKRIVRPFAPRVYQVVLDVEIRRNE